MVAHALAALLLSQATFELPPSAETVVFLPRPDRLQGVLAFFEAAGMHSPALHPNSWKRHLHPLWDVDVTSAPDLRQHGLSPSAAVAAGFQGRAQFFCAQLSDSSKATSSALAALSEWGSPAPKQLSGSSAYFAGDGTPKTAGFFVRGRHMCASGGSRLARALLEEAARTSASPPSPPKGLPGQAYAKFRRTWVGLRGTATKLLADGLGTDVPLPALTKAKKSAYSSRGAPGLLYVRGQLSSAALKPSIEEIASALAALCESCPGGAGQALAGRLAPLLTGQFAWRIEGQSPSMRALKTKAGRVLGVSQAVLAEVRSPEAMGKVLSESAGWPGVEKRGSGGYAMRSPFGVALWGVEKRQLYFATGDAPLKSALASVSPESAAIEHGMEFTLWPSQVEKALAGLSLFDVLGNPEWAPVLWASAELSGLLSHSEDIRGWADSAGPKEHRFWMAWTLKPAPRHEGRDAPRPK